LPLIFDVVLKCVMKKVQENLEGLKLNGRRTIRVCSVDIDLMEENTSTELFEMIVGVLTTSFSRCNPMRFLSMGLRQRSGLCSSSSRKYPGTEGTNQNRH